MGYSMSNQRKNSLHGSDFLWKLSMFFIHMINDIKFKSVYSFEDTLNFSQNTY